MALVNFPNTFSPATATQTLLAEQRIPALGDDQFQEWAKYLFEKATPPLRLHVAETLFRHDRQHPKAAGLFLACTIPLAQVSAKRFVAKITPPPPDLTGELMYNGAVNALRTMFQEKDITAGVSFDRALYRSMRDGAVKAAFRRMENTHIRGLRARDDQPRRPRLDEQLSAKQMLENIAGLTPSPETPYIGNFLRCIVEIGPHDAVKPLRRSGKQQLHIDLEPICKEMEIPPHTAAMYLKQARQMLKEKFDRDGTLFTKTDRSRTGTGGGATAKQSSQDSSNAARLFARDTLGETAKLRAAETQAGSYRGEIIGETEHHIVQQLTGKSSVAHPKQLLERLPAVGDTVRINYSNGKGVVREVRQHPVSHELAR